jgi:hypothetical protein
MFNQYPGHVSDAFFDLLETYANDDWDMICYLLGDGQ